jgi:signal transduction histidine kinase
VRVWGNRHLVATGLAWALCAVAAVLVLVNVGLGVQTLGHPVPPLFEFRWWEALSPLTAIGFSGVGALIVGRRLDNRLGWLACATGLLTSAYVFAQSYATYALYAHPGTLPGGEWMAWFRTWSWYLAATLMLVLVPLLFPDGRLPSRTWRPVVWVIFAVSGLYCTVTALTAPPVGVLLPAWLVAVSTQVAGITQVVGAVAAAGAVVARYRASSIVVRQQIKWLAVVAVLEATLWIVSLIPAFFIYHVAPYRVPLLEILIPLALLGLPIAIGIAVFRYRLYEVDVVIGRALVYAVLAIFVTLSYVAVIGGAGLIVGGRFNLVLSVIVTAAVAVAFQPVRERAERLAARLVYGRRGSPYEVLANLTRQMSDAESVDEVLSGVAAAVAQGVGATVVRVALLLPGGVNRTGAWPAGAAIDPNGLRVIIGRADAPTGEVEITLPPGESLGESEERLLAAVATQADVSLRRLRLAAELAERVDELAASRTRMAQAEERGRRRLERDLHDGVQQEVVALIAKLRLARIQIQRDPTRVDSTLQEAQGEAGQMLTDLRELARGIHPAVLGSRGLVEAIEAVAARMPIGVSVNADDRVRSTRYAEEIEGAAYFTVTEGLANVLKHSGASEASVTISAADSGITLQLADDGCGFDPYGGAYTGLQGLRDRLEAVGGSLRVDSGSCGTTLAARLPARPR